MGRRIVNLAGRPEVWLCLLFAWMLLSALRSWHTPWVRVAGTEALRWGAGLTLTLALGRGLPRLRLATQALTVLLAALVLTILAAGLGPGGLVTGPFRDHQLCASVLLLLLPFAVALALTADTPAWQWGAQIISLAAAVCLALTETRSAWLGGAASTLVFAGLWLRRPSSLILPRRCPTWIIPVLLAASVVGAFLLLASSTDLAGPLAMRARTLQAVGQDGSWRARVRTWHGALEMAAARPLLGWGLGRYPGAQWAWTREGRPLSAAQRPSLSEQAHDLYLQTGVELGGVGLALYAAALGTLARRSRRALRRGEGRRRGLPQALSVATLALLAGQGVDALASPSYQFSEVSLLFWVCLGLGLAAVNRRDGAEAAVVLPPVLRRALRASAAGTASIVLAAQVIPLGLLTPVEAYYNTPSGWTYQSVSVSPTSVTSPTNAQIVLTATYKDATGATQMVTVPGDTGSYKITTSSAYSSVNPAGNMTISKLDKNKTLTVTATFTDGSGTHPATGGVVVH